MDLPPDYATRSHDESESGQQELYVALRGAGAVVVGPEEHALDAEHLVVVDAGVGRLLKSGPEGLRVLCVGAVPGGDVVRLVVGQAMQLTLLGAGIGLAAAFALTRGMTSQLFGVSSTDPPTYVVVAAILVLSSVLAAWVPAYRATRVDPIRALRCD